MTFFKFFFHCFTLIIRKCCVVIVFVITTIYVPTFSEGSSFLKGDDIFKFSNSRPMLFIKPLEQPISFLPLIADSRVNWGLNFEQIADLNKSLAKFSPSFGKSNKFMNLFVPVFSKKGIYQGGNERTKKETESRKVYTPIIKNEINYLFHFGLIILSFLIGCLTGYLPFRLTLRKRVMEILLMANNYYTNFLFLIPWI